MTRHTSGSPLQGLGGGLNAEAERLRSADLYDPADGSVAGRHVGQRPRGLLAALMVRAGALPPLPAQPVKRGRGRPPKAKGVAA